MSDSDQEPKIRPSAKLNSEPELVELADSDNSQAVNSDNAQPLLTEGELPTDSGIELVQEKLMQGKPVQEKHTQEGLTQDKLVQEKLIEEKSTRPSLFITVKDCLVEKSPEVILRPRKKLDRASRRDFLIYGAGMAGALASFGWLLPNEVKMRLGLESQDTPLKEAFLSRVLKFDDSVGQALFSKHRLVPTYSKAEMTAVPNNFAGQTPDPGFISNWKLRISGLAGGGEEQIPARYFQENFTQYEQITRLVCVEGWSAISWWGGVRFADFIRTFPPQVGAKWIQIRSDVNLDGSGNSDPYFVSIDLDSAFHPQTLLVTHHNGHALELEHGAPLRLLVPMKLGLKNIKAITAISYHVDEPDDYWNKEGYSYYDGI